MQIFSNYKITFAQSLTQDDLNAICAWNNAYQGTGTFSNAIIRIFDEDDTTSAHELAKKISNGIYATDESGVYIYDFFEAMEDLSKVCPSIGFSAWIGSNDYSSGMAQAGTCENVNGQFSQTVYNCDPDTFEPISDEEESYEEVMDTIQDKYYRRGYPDEIQCQFDYAEDKEERLGIVVNDLCKRIGASSVETELCSAGFTADAAHAFVDKWENVSFEDDDSDDEDDAEEVPIDREAMIQGLLGFWNYMLANYDNESMREIVSEFENDVKEIKESDCEDEDIVNIFINIIFVIVEDSVIDTYDEIGEILKAETKLTEQQISLLI